MRVIPGEVLRLKISQIDEDGIMLGSDQEDSTIPLAKEDHKHDFKEGDELDVFIHVNENIEIEATTNLPEISLNEVGCFRVKNSGSAGSFIDIGTSRDVIIPTHEQKRKYEPGDKVVIVLKYDFDKKRIYASTNFNKSLTHEKFKGQIGDTVEGVVAEKLHFGRKIIIENKWIGVIFRKDIMRPLRLGDKLKFYVLDNMERDVVLSMQKMGDELIEETKERILDLLRQHNGYMRLTNDTDPEEIKLRLRVSKKTFKKAAKELSEEGLIKLTKRGIKTIKEQDA